jgi:hypothetical protein
MTLAALIQKGGLSRVASANPANSANEGGTEGKALARLATLALAQPRNATNDTGGESDSILDPAAESRRQRVLDMLAERPDIRYAVLTDTQADPDAVILALAIRGRATCELRIPREKYDPFLLLDLIERHGGTLH